MPVLHHLPHTTLPRVQSTYAVTAFATLLPMLRPDTKATWRMEPGHRFNLPPLPTEHRLTRNHCSSCLTRPQASTSCGFCAKDFSSSPHLNLTPFPRTVPSFSANPIFAVLITCTQFPSSVIRVEFSPLLILQGATSPPQADCCTPTLLLPLPSEPSARVRNPGFL